MAITQSGVMYSMGGGLYGKLGLGDQKNRTRPTKVVALSHENISDVACGSFHTMILTQSGVVYGCGFGGLVEHVSIDSSLSQFKSIDRYFASGLVQHDSIDSSLSPIQSIDGYIASGLVKHDSID